MQEPPSDSPVDDSGHHCDRVTPAEQPADDKPSLASLRGALTDLPDATHEDFLEIKAIWEPRLPPNAPEPPTPNDFHS